MRVRWPAIAMTVLLGGCDLLFGIDHVAGPDASLTDGAPADALCLGAGLLNVCAEATGPIDLETAINTTIDSRCRKVPQDNGLALCVIDGTTITVSEHVQVTGTSPLVLLATSTVEIGAPLDASSSGATRIGAGAQSTCASAPGTNGSTGAGGGGGGSYGYVGGPGASGQMGQVNTTPGGSAGPVLPQLGIYGGCAGGAGGIVVGTAAVGGAGGGAIYIIAGDQIHVASTGSINASGGGGRGAPMRGGGGGGGGSGGFIALDAPTIVVDGPVFARGAGGGGGGGVSTGGGAAIDPMATGSAAGGIAGTGGSNGAHGCGTPNGNTGGITASAPYGGGGGGGGCGRIRVYGAQSGAGVINPEPT